VRTRSRSELLLARSQVVLAAKAHRLEAIDMVRFLYPAYDLPEAYNIGQVCVDYRDISYLREECEDGRRLGFTGKVCLPHDGYCNHSNVRASLRMV
jgi:citrate lyase subunit beta-like protein